MRIALYENLPPGGALRASYGIGIELLRRGHEIDLFRLSTYGDKGPFDLAPHVAHVNVVPYRPFAGALDARLRTGHLAPRSYTLFAPLKRVHKGLASRIKAGNYDAVLLHSDAMTDAPYVLRWLDGIPTVYYCHEPLRYRSERGVLQQHREKLASSRGMIGPLRVLEDRLVLDRLAAADIKNIQHASAVVVNSVYTRERVWAAYARSAVVCYQGVDSSRFVPAASGSVRRHEVLSFGGPIQAKGHHQIVEALGLLPSPRPAFRVVLPRGADPASLRKAAAAAGVELIVESELGEEEAVERYQGALVTVCAARLEPFGLTVLESLACGTPVVALREAGYRETIIDEMTGVLVEPDATSIAAGIHRLVLDPALAAKLGAAGRKDVEDRWTWRRTGDKMEEILQGAAKR